MAATMSLAAACATAGRGATSSIGGAEWHAIEIDGTAAVPNDVSQRPSLLVDIDSARVSGSAGCNRFGGGATVSGETIRFTKLFSTRRACIDDRLNQQETRYLAALEAVDRFSISGDTLTLFAAGQPRAKFTR
jgi:heat shock protein HslJ